MEVSQPQLARSTRFLDAFVSYSRHDDRDEACAGIAEVDRPSVTGRLAADSGQCFRARTIVGEIMAVRFEHGAVDFAKTRAAVDDAGVSHRHQNEWRCIGRIRDERLRRRRSDSGTRTSRAMSPRRHRQGS